MTKQFGKARHKVFMLCFSFAAMLVINGCSGSGCCASKSESIDLTDKSESFKDGYREGCTTAHGEYIKNSDRFKNDSEYYDGWFAGRRACQYDNSK